MLLKKGLRTYLANLKIKFKALFTDAFWIKLKGIRFGKAYTVSGTTGLQINLYNGKEILIGTQKPEALIQTLNNIIK